MVMGTRRSIYFVSVMIIVGYVYISLMLEGGSQWQWAFSRAWFNYCLQLLLLVGYPLMMGFSKHTTSNESITGIHHDTVILERLQYVLQIQVWSLCFHEEKSGLQQ
jgi:hypothetical protein